jgi:ribonuclease HI
LEKSIGRRPQRRKIPRFKKTPAITSIPVAWFDGAAQANGILSGVGGIIKQAGNIIYRWTLNCGPGTNTWDELMGVWASFILATRLEIDQLQVLGD